MKRFSPRHRPVYVLAAVILFPLIPWLMVGSLGDRFSGSAILKSVANLAAFFAIAAWAVNLVLATRIPLVERAAGGLESPYRLHRRIGVLVVVLAVTHVLFLSLHAWGSALDLYLPSAAGAGSAGWLRSSRWSASSSPVSSAASPTQRSCVCSGCSV